MSAWLAVLAGAAGCTDDNPAGARASSSPPVAFPTQRPPATTAPTLGTVTGVVLGFGGPSPGRTITPQPGTVTLTGGGHHYRTTFGGDGRFRISVPGGHYAIEASAFGLTCQGRVTVRAGSVSHADALCPIP